MSKAKNLRYEPLQESHIDAILVIEEKCQSAPWSRASFTNELKNAQSIFRVAFAGGEIVGYGGLWKIVDEAHITTLAVDPDSRGQGIGLGLMRDILGKAKREGMLCATLEVRAGNEPAIQLYHKLGFESVAVRRRYYPDNREDAVIMWLYNLQEKSFD